MPETDSIYIDEREKRVQITLNPTLYPQSAVMRAAYRFTDEFNVIVDGDALSKIFVIIKIKPEDKSGATKEEMEQLANDFFSELIHANVEEMQTRRYADTRNALIGAALRNLMPQITPENLQKIFVQKDENKQKSPFDIIYPYMPKLNCGRCGSNCEEIAKKIASGEDAIDMCVHLKKAEFSVVREELNNALKKLQTAASSRNNLS